MWTLCELALHMLLSKLKIVDMREYSLDQVNIPRMYFQEQSSDFENKTDYLSQDFKKLAKHEDGENVNSNNNAGPAPKRTSEMPTRDPSKRLRNA